MNMNVTDDGLILRLGNTPIRVWTFGADNEFIGVALDDDYRHATVHIAVDPLDPSGLCVFTYGNVRQ